MPKLDTVFFKEEVLLGGLPRGEVGVGESVPMEEVRRRLAFLMVSAADAKLFFVWRTGTNTTLSQAA